MSVGLDSEGLFAIYADWIAFLREKRVTFAGQLAKVQGKEAAGKEIVEQPLLLKPNGQATETRLSTTGVPLPDSQHVPSPKKEMKIKTPASAPVFAGPSWFEAALPVPEAENRPPPDEKGDEIPEWLWQAEDSTTLEGENEMRPSLILEDEDGEKDEWM